MPREPEPGPFDERSLVERARSDPDAFAALYRHHVARIHAFALRRTGSREMADDITAAAFERALRGLPGFVWRGGGFGAWVHRIAANEIAGTYRRAALARSPRAVAAARTLSDDRGATADPSETWRDPADIEALRAALDMLRPRYQRAISLRYLAGLDHDESARAMGVSKPVMAVTLTRAKKALQRALGEEAP